MALHPLGCLPVPFTRARGECANTLIVSGELLFIFWSFSQSQLFPAFFSVPQAPAPPSPSSLPAGDLAPHLTEEIAALGREARCVPIRPTTGKPWGAQVYSARGQKQRESFWRHSPGRQLGNGHFLPREASPPRLEV